MGEKDQAKKPEQEKKEEEVQKDLDEILSKIRETEGKQPPPPASKEQEEKKTPEPTPEESAEEEGVETILEKLSEKDETSPQMGVLQRVVGVFYQPTKVFQSLRVKPDFIVPLILVLLVTLVTTYLVYDIAIREQMARIEQNENIPDEQKDIILDRLEASLQGGTQRILSSTVAPVISTIVGTVIVALILLGIGNFLLGGQARFVQMYSVYLYALLIPTILGSLVKVPLILQNQSTRVQTSLALFLSSEQSRTLLYRFLANFDVFTIWFVIVLGIGFATLYRFRPAKGIAAVVISWLVWVVLKTFVFGSLAMRFGA